MASLQNAASPTQGTLCIQGGAGAVWPYGRPNIVVGRPNPVVGCPNPVVGCPKLKDGPAPAAPNPPPPPPPPTIFTFSKMFGSTSFQIRWPEEATARKSVSPSAIEMLSPTPSLA